MLTIDKTETYGWEAAIRGMRNPMNSWDKSDSEHICESCEDPWGGTGYIFDTNRVTIGPNDLDLMKRLRNAGTDHRKYLRMITVYCDITAPLYWWKEFDTYKVGTVANSCSTMHKIQAKEFVMEDFSFDHLNEKSIEKVVKPTLEMLNEYRNLFIETKNKDYWWQMIQLLQSHYLEIIMFHGM